jgi:hypothetical protein
VHVQTEAPPTLSVRFGTNRVVTLIRKQPDDRSSNSVPVDQLPGGAARPRTDPGGDYSWRAIDRRALPFLDPAGKPARSSLRWAWPTLPLAFRANRGFEAAAITAASVFLLGDAVGHVREMVSAGNFQPGKKVLPSGPANGLTAFGQLNRPWVIGSTAATI